MSKKTRIPQKQPSIFKIPQSDIWRIDFVCDVIKKRNGDFDIRATFKTRWGEDKELVKEIILCNVKKKGTDMDEYMYQVVRRLARKSPSSKNFGK